MFHQNIQTENQQIQLPLLQEKQIELWIKREDLIHPYVSGNKFRKLKYNIQQAKHLKKNTLLTFGGAFSNHIVATSVAGKIYGFNTIGVIRGEELAKNLNKVLKENTTLAKAHECGMHFDFISRQEYRNKTNIDFIEKLKAKYGDFYLIPEGGTNDLAIKGCQEILVDTDKKFNFICTSVGTGGTIAGLINSAKKHQSILGFPALKENFIEKEIKQLTNKSQNWRLMDDYHFGGYAKCKPELLRFINDFKRDTNILLDPIYTGKMLFGILEMIKKNSFKRGTKILAIHTGGIQG